MTVLPYWFVCVIPSLYDIQISRRSLPWLFWCHSPKYAVVFCLRGRKRSVPFIQFEATNRLKEISCLTFYQVSILIYWLQLLDDWRYTSIFSITYFDTTYLSKAISYEEPLHQFGSNMRHKWTTFLFLHNVLVMQVFPRVIPFINKLPRRNKAKCHTTSPRMQFVSRNCFLCRRKRREYWKRPLFPLKINP